MKAFVALGKIGDVCSVLPILWREHEKATKPVNVVISAQYASLLDRIPYTKPHVFPGKWYDLAAALKWAKERFNEVVPLTVYGESNGEPFPVEQRTSSFQLEPWERVGMLGEWDRIEVPAWPAPKDFVFPVNAAILMADHSESSPFLQKQELHSLLVASFPHHVITRVSEISVKAPLGWIDVYDSFKALVTIDTAHLHLSQFTKTPVFALANDKPTKWSGSAWSKRFAFYCRYSEFEDRKQELIEVMRERLGGVSRPEIVELN